MERAGTIRLGTPAGRWVVAATVLGSGIAFLDGTVVNVALPAIQEDLHTGVAGLQWTLDAYLLTLGSLLVLGGALGDMYGRRRIFVIGLVAFTAASLLCGIAPNIGFLIAARALQGVGGALLIPGSLALLSASFCQEDRPRAIGAWSGLAGVWTAIGPFLGGWLVDGVSWRLVFLINLPAAAVTIWISMRHVPESLDAEDVRTLDVTGAALITFGLAGVVYALIEGPAHQWGVGAVAAGVAGAIALVLFPFVELRAPHPMVPMTLFRNRQFTGANLTTFAVYAALSVTTFLLVLHLQRDLHYSALEAGAALLPFTVLMLAFSSRSAALAQRIGPRLQMTVGPLLAAVGLLLLGEVEPGSSYVGGVLPGVLVLGAALTITVAPLTATVLGSVDDAHMGTGSAVNNAVARIAGLLAIAVLPALAGLTADDLTPAEFDTGYRTAMRLAAGLCVVGGAVAFVTIRRVASVRPATAPDAVHPCHGEGVRLPVPAAAGATSQPAG